MPVNGKMKAKTIFRHDNAQRLVPAVALDRNFHFIARLEVAQGSHHVRWRIDSDRSDFQHHVAGKEGLGIAFFCLDDQYAVVCFEILTQVFIDRRQLQSLRMRQPEPDINFPHCVLPEI